VEPCKPLAMVWCNKEYRTGGNAGILEDVSYAVAGIGAGGLATGASNSQNYRFESLTNRRYDMSIPGFTAERSLFGLSSQHVTFDGSECNGAIRPEVVGSFGERAITRPDSVPGFETNLNGQGSLSIAAESEPGGPSTVPPGYGRDCKRVPFTICAGNRCWIDYYWVCTYYPLPRTQ